MSQPVEVEETVKDRLRELFSENVLAKILRTAINHLKENVSCITSRSLPAKSL